jgi:TRAP transporter TAXI family solute receptor
LKKSLSYFSLMTLLLISLLFLLAGCGETLAETDKKITLHLATGGSGSSYASLGQEVAEWINARSDKVYVVPVLSAGPEANLRILAAKGPQLGIVTADLAHYAREGSEFFHDKGAADFQLLALLDAEALYILCPEAGKLKDAEGLKGKRISLGRGGGRSHTLVYRLLQGMEFALDPATLSFLAAEEALLSLEEKRLDAAFLLGPLQGEAAVKAGEYRILPWSKKQEELLQEILPFFITSHVPEGSFARQDEDMFIPAIPVLLAATTDLPQELVDELAAALEGTRFQWLEAEAGPGT